MIHNILADAIATVLTATISLSVLLAVALVVTVIGLGLICLAGASGHPSRLLMAPGLALAASVVVIVIAVLSGQAVGAISVPIWCGWAIAAIVGLSKLPSAVRDGGGLSYPMYAVVTSLLVCIGYLRYGLFDYLGSPAPDGWSYISFAEYLRAYPRGTEGGLAPLYEYAAHLADTRFAASALLAALVPPGSGFDTQQVSGVFIFLAVFAYACAMLLVGRACQNSVGSPLMPIACGTALLGGWLPLALEANNYDNLLALFLAPTLWALAVDRELSERARTALLALQLAACTYIYPELSPLIALAYALGSWDRSAATTTDHLKSGGPVQMATRIMKPIAIALILLAPYLSRAIAYFGRQVAAATAPGVRPGEGFLPAILQPRRLPGLLWGLDDPRFGLLAGTVLGCVALIGLRSLYMAGRRGIAFGVPLGLCLAGWLAFGKSYDYGAYKILLCMNWCLAVALGTGVERIHLALRRPVPKRTLASCFLVALITMVPLLWVRNLTLGIDRLPFKSASSFRDAKERIASLGLPVEVKVTDPIANAWMVYELRTMPAHFTTFQGYMSQPHVLQFMNRSKMPDFSATQLLLADGVPQSLHVLWSSDALWLVARTGPQ